MTIASDKKTLSQAIAHIAKADTAAELEPILNSVLEIVMNTEDDDAKKTLVAHVAQLMHQAHEEIRKAEQKNSATALTTAMKQNGDTNKALRDAERLVELREETIKERDQRIRELELQLNGHTQNATLDTEADGDTNEREQNTLTPYTNAPPILERGTESVGEPGDGTPAPDIRTTGSHDSPTAEIRTLPQNIRMPLGPYGPPVRAPPLEPFYGYHDDNQRVISKPQWETWHGLFELHYGMLSEPTKLYHLQLHLRGEALAFRTQMLDMGTQVEYKSLVKAFAQHYADTKAPHVALKEFNQMLQGTTDIKSFARKFQQAYAEAVKLNPYAAQSPQYLCTNFVSKVDPELMRILNLRHPDYAQKMPLHQVVAHLADIEQYAYPHTQPTYGHHRGRGGRGFNSFRGRHQGRNLNKYQSRTPDNNDSVHRTREPYQQKDSVPTNPSTRGRGTNRSSRGGRGGQSTAQVAHASEVNVPNTVENEEQYYAFYADTLSTETIGCQTNKVESPDQPTQKQAFHLAYSELCRSLYNSAKDRRHSALTNQGATHTLSINGIELRVLCDTGSQANLISNKQLKSLVAQNEQWRASDDMRTDLRADDQAHTRLRSITGNPIQIISFIDVLCAPRWSPKAPRITLCVTDRPIANIVLGLPALKALGYSLMTPEARDLVQKVAMPPTALHDKTDDLSSREDKQAAAQSAVHNTRDTSPQQLISEPPRTVSDINTDEGPPTYDDKAYLIAYKTFTVQPGQTIRAATRIRGNPRVIQGNKSYCVEMIHAPLAYICDSHVAAKEQCHIRNDHEHPMLIQKGTKIASIEAVKPDEEAYFYQLTQEYLEGLSVQTTEASPHALEHRDPRWNERTQFVSQHLKFGTAFAAEQQKQIRSLIELYADLVCLDNSDLPPSKAPPFHIETGDAPPFKIRPRPVPPAARECLMEDIQNMLKGRIIERVIDSPYNSPVVVVPKRGTNKWRMTVDLRKLNEQTTFAVARLPSIRELIYGLKDKPFISRFDCQSAFWQVMLEPNDRNKTTFTVPGPAPLGGTYRFLRMPFGAINSAQHFQHAIETVLQPVTVCDQSRLCQAYLDDIIIATASFEEHLELLKKFLQCLRNNQCKLNLTKSMLGAKEIAYLGYYVDSISYRPQPERMAPILSIPAPKSLTDVRSFIGKLLYYQKCLPDLQSILEPLHELLRGVKPKGKRRNTGPFHWGDAQQRAFEEARSLLANAVPLYHPDISRPFELVCDASDFGIGAALAQEDAKGIRHPIAFMSRILSRAQRKYSVTEKEFLAVLLGLEANRQWLASAQVDILTDHAPLIPLLKGNKETSPRLERWRCRMQYFQIRSIRYIPGPLNTSADFLSRLGQEPQTPEDDTASDVGIPDFIKDMPGVVAVSNDAHHHDQEQEGDWYELIPPKDAKLYNEQCSDSECCTLYDLVQHEQKARNIGETLNTQRTKTNAKPKPTTTSEPEQKAPAYLRSFARICNIVDDHLVAMSPVTDQYVPVVPKSMRAELLKMAHSTPESGHIRMPKLYRLLSTRCTWPRMRRDINRYLDTCTTCTTVNPGLAYKPEWHFEAPSAPMQTLCMDVAKFANKDPMYALVITCAFTRYIWAIPINSQDAVTQITELTKWVISQQGYPQCIITDAHATYRSNEFRAWCESNGIEHRPGTGYNHTHNSLAERAIETVRNKLRKASLDATDWEKRLPLLLLAHNSAPHLTTGLSPQYLMYGREPRLAIDRILQTPKRVRPGDAPSHALRQAATLAEAYQSCCENTRKERAKAAEQYAKARGRNSPKKVSVGDLVLRRSTKALIRSQNWKLRRAFGPYRVISISDVHVTLETMSGEKVNERIHINDLTPLRNKSFTPCYLSEASRTEPNRSHAQITTAYACSMAHSDGEEQMQQDAPEDEQQVKDLIDLEGLNSLEGTSNQVLPHDPVAPETLVIEQNKAKKKKRSRNRNARRASQERKREERAKFRRSENYHRMQMAAQLTRETIAWTMWEYAPRTTDMYAPNGTANTPQTQHRAPTPSATQPSSSRQANAKKRMTKNSKEHHKKPPPRL